MITDALLNPKVVKLINFQNSVILSKFDKKFSKVNQAIYSLAPISIPNMKALAQILFEISCTQDFQDFFSKGDNSERGHNSEKKKNMGHLFFHEESIYEISRHYHPLFKFQISSESGKIDKFSKFRNFVKI